MPTAKFTVYCEIGFLEILYNKITQPLENFLYQPVNHIVYLYQMLHNHSDLLIDLDNQEFIARATKKTHPNYNPNLKKLIKNGRINAILHPSEFKRMWSDNTFFQQLNHPQSFFFLSKTPAQCLELSESYGYIFMSDKELEEKIPFLFTFDIQNLIKDETLKDWCFLKKYRHPFNALIIADNYILDRRLDENLLNLLGAFMPKKLKYQVFHLTLLVHEDANVSDRTQELINNFLDDFDYEIKLTILKTNKIHDRNILTNYMWINSGYGFELFNKENVSKETQLFLFPTTYLKTDFQGWFEKRKTASELKNTILETITHLLKNYKNINDKTTDIGTTTNVYGTKINRLLE